MAQALKNNSDIRLADSKVREAEAQLEKTRVEVMQKVLRAYHEIALQKKLTESAQKKFEWASTLHKRGALSQEELRAATDALQQAKANLAKAEADMPFLVGSGPAHYAAFSADGKTLFALSVQQASEQSLEQPAKAERQLEAAERYLALRKMTPPVKASTIEKIRELLNTPVQGEFTPEKLQQFLEEKAKGLNVFNQATLDPGQVESVNFKQPVPLGAALQWFEDRHGWRFVVRDYGIVIANKGRVPAGASLLENIWQPASAK